MPCFCQVSKTEKRIGILPLNSTGVQTTVRMLIQENFWKRWFFGNLKSSLRSKESLRTCWARLASQPAFPLGTGPLEVRPHVVFDVAVFSTTHLYRQSQRCPQARALPPGSQHWGIVTNNLPLTSCPSSESCPIPCASVLGKGLKTLTSTPIPVSCLAP